MSTTTPETARWSGWWRPSPSVPWQRIVTADDGPACWSALLARQLPSGDLLVSQDNTPNERRGRR